MPFYEYVCDSCQHEFEVFQKITAPPADSCSRCQGREVRRKLFATISILKGAGFYETEYGRSKHNNPASTAKTDAPAKAGTASGDSSVVPKEGSPAPKEGSAAPKSDSGATASTAAPSAPAPAKEKAA